MVENDAQLRQLGGLPSERSVGGSAAISPGARVIPSPKNVACNIDYGRFAATFLGRRVGRTGSARVAGRIKEYLNNPRK